MDKTVDLLAVDGEDFRMKACIALLALGSQIAIAQRHPPPRVP